MYKKIIILFYFVLFQSIGQDKPRGKFLKDKIKIGEPVEYSLSIKYPTVLEIIYPDSTYTFTPFEFVNKRFFKTKSDSIFSYDSVIYELSTFEIDSIQHLAIPIFLIENGDSTKLFPVPDSITIIPSLTQVPDSVSLMVNTNYVEVEKDFNLRYLFFGIIVVLLVVGSFILIFGKTILKSIKIKRIRKQHYKFLMSFKEISGSINLDNYEPKLQGAYSLWKSYLQQLTGRAFTSYSTKEISAIVKDDLLKKTLQEIDRAIYAHRFPAQPDQLLKVLQDFAHKFYERKISDLKHGSKK